MPSRNLRKILKIKIKKRKKKKEYMEHYYLAKLPLFIGYWNMKHTKFECILKLNLVINFGR